MTRENEFHLNEALVSVRKGNQSLDEYLKKFKSLCDQLATMKKRIDDLTKIMHLARGLGSKYREFKTTMLSKPPHPTYNQFVLALKSHEQQVILEAEEEKTPTMDHNHAFYTQRGRSRGRGRSFSSRGRGFQQGKSPSML